MNSASLSLPHFLLALGVVAIWGSNFVVIKLGLTHLPPLLFAALRFAIAAVPLIFFLKRPDLPWRNIAAFGMFIGVGQFGLLFIAMQGHISPGLASLVIQMQVFFTVFLAMRLEHERVKPRQWLALVMAASGIAIIVVHTDGTTTIGGLAMMLLAAFSWSCGNMVVKRAGKINMVAYVVWSSAFSVPPLLLLSIIFEGWPAITEGLVHADTTTWLAVLWQASANSIFGYAAWGWLLARYPAATITPMALLVPVFGMAASSWWLNESMPAWKLTAMSLVIGGLAINLLWRTRSSPPSP